MLGIGFYSGRLKSMIALINTKHMDLNTKQKIIKEITTLKNFEDNVIGSNLKKTISVFRKFEQDMVNTLKFIEEYDIREPTNSKRAINKIKEIDNDLRSMEELFKKETKLEKKIA